MFEKLQQFRVRNVENGRIIIYSTLKKYYPLSYYWRKALRVWFYANCGLRLEGTCREPHAEEKLFDAFVSYSNKDEGTFFQNFFFQISKR